MVREIDTREITAAVKRLCVEANEQLGADVLQCFRAALDKETSPVGREILDQLLENARIAREEQVPICQDTGLAVIFLEVGQEVHLTGGDLKEAVNQGVREGYGEGYLRKSSCHPFTRANTGDNTPAVIYIDIVPGDRVKVMVVPKGGGSENMSRLFMLPPSAGLAGVKERVLETVKEAGPNPCPRPSSGWVSGGPLNRPLCRPRNRCYGRWVPPTPIRNWRSWSRACWPRSINWASDPRAWAAGPLRWQCMCGCSLATLPVCPWRSMSSAMPAGIKKPLI